MKNLVIYAQKKGMIKKLVDGEYKLFTILEVLNGELSKRNNKVFYNFLETKSFRIKKPQRKEQEKHLKSFFRHTKEIKDSFDDLSLEKRIEEIENFSCAKVTSKSKGKGFQGCIKKFGYAGGRGSHGGKKTRKMGSIGSAGGRIMKGKKMPGRMGGNYVTKIANLQSINGRSLMFYGSVAGHNKSIIRINFIKNE